MAETDGAPRTAWFGAHNGALTYEEALLANVEILPHHYRRWGMDEEAHRLLMELLRKKNA